MTVHDARRTCATLLVDLEVHPQVIMRIRHHADVSMTLKMMRALVPMATREAQRRLRQPPAMRGSILGFVAVLTVFCCCMAANEALTNSGVGLSPAETLVGVTGFEPAASSSRTTSEVVANGR